MTDEVKDAFFAYVPREQLDDRGEEDALIPLGSVPEALERLGLDGDDDLVLSILREAAEPMGRDRGVPYPQWKEVVEVLLAQQGNEDDQSQASPAAVGGGEPSRRRRQPARAAARAAQPNWVVEDEDEDEDGGEDDADDSEEEDAYEEGDRRRRRNGRALNELDPDDEDDDEDDDDEGGFLPAPSRRKRAPAPPRRSKVTEAHRERAEHVFGLFQDQLTEKEERLSAQDLVAIAKKMGDTLTLAEAQEMVDQAIRLGNEQSSGPYTASGVSPFELAAVIRKLGMRRS